MLMELQMNNSIADFLCEIGVEELPSGAVQPLGEALALNIAEGFKQADIVYANMHYYASPRRIAVYFTGVTDLLPAKKITRRGPAHANSLDANGQPLPSLLGFAKSCGVGMESLSVLKTDKGAWWIYEAETKAISSRELLPKILTESIQKLPIKKLMRWGEGEFEFVRPVHWILALWNNEILDLNLLGVQAGRISYGHRFHHPQAVTVSASNMYEELLLNANVIADFSKRRQMVINEVTALAQQHGYNAVMPEALIDEVTSIVEMPYALIIPFDSAFLSIPDEVLITAMQVHQKCFALYDNDHNLQPYFITVANIKSKNPNQVVLGNKQVMHARLSDAAFFYQQDQLKPLSAYIPETALVVFQAGLGSLADQSKRLQCLINFLIDPVKLNAENSARATMLSQCDLLTGMVGEFPELQGVMGYYYALHAGESQDVALALREQYYPRFASDQLPTSSLGLALSLVTRLDLLVGAFLLGKKPSGVKDPFKLRRHALALVRLMLSLDAPLRLTDLLNCTSMVYADCVNLNGDIISELKNFIWERLQSWYQSQGITHDVILAVRACEDDCLIDVDRRIQAMCKFQLLPEARSLSSICKRVGHLLQAADLTEDLIVNEELFKDISEIKLFECLKAVELLIPQYNEQNKYEDLLILLASLHDPVNDFFVNVLVNVDDVMLKRNRLALLLRLQATLKCVADLSFLDLLIIRG